eukprot:COSAG02_NODE_3720_length_6323_cov_7.586600_5_plen_510_part_00
MQIMPQSDSIREAARLRQAVWVNHAAWNLTTDSGMQMSEWKAVWAVDANQQDLRVAYVALRMALTGRQWLQTPDDVRSFQDVSAFGHLRIGPGTPQTQRQIFAVVRAALTDDGAETETANTAPARASHRSPVATHHAEAATSIAQRLELEQPRVRGHEGEATANSPFALGISHIAVEEEEQSFIQHGRGELDIYNELIAEYDKFEQLDVSQRLNLMMAVNFMENAVLKQTIKKESRNRPVQERMRKDWAVRLQLPLSNLTEEQLCKPNFSTSDLWDIADPPARLVYINKNGKPIDEKAETKLLHANIQIAADRKNKALIRAETELREIVNTKGTVQQQVMQLALLGVSEISTVEELTTAATSADREHAVTAAAVELSISRSSDQGEENAKATTTTRSRERSSMNQSIAELRHEESMNKIMQAIEPRAKATARTEDQVDADIVKECKAMPQVKEQGGLWSLSSTQSVELLLQTLTLKFRDGALFGITDPPSLHPIPPPTPSSTNSIHSDA